ncbi:ferritin family protein [Paenibacillus oryzisoli]|uniref:Rubrerythrin n=1 Tax=Paenibacillus oryzisoli TaxID=1850517 RepID=A0A197ZVZ8_9BACL|nr:ferritin-like domain-containing protein [Paenibacillus oryzisoli]OAS13374.1 rubrerythrin [Paenibacillus oryzisoli]
MYWNYSYAYRNTFQPMWNVGYGHALELIKTAVQDERNDELFYDQLIKLAPTPEQAAIITSIRDDERSHNAMFRSMYREMTGQEIYGVSDEQYQPVRTYSEGIQKALQGELAAVEKYRKIWFGLPYGIYKDTVYGIILDELKHASKYNYLFTLNR